MKVDMDIEHRKESFLNLLRSAYKAQEERDLIAKLLPGYDSRNVTIQEKILRQYGFSERDFWEIICPSLNKEGFIESYSDPDLSSVYEDFYDTSPEYKRLGEKITELDESLPPSYSFAKAYLGKTPDYRGTDADRVRHADEEIEKARKERRTFATQLRPEYHHRFIVTEKLIESTFSESSHLRKIHMSFDSQNGVLRLGNIKHGFHRGGRDDKPLLRLFRKLWDERRHVRSGVQKKEGKPFLPEVLAIQTEVSKDKIFSLLKSISRILQRFPAKIERKNGILLLVTEK